MLESLTMWKIVFGLAVLWRVLFQDGECKMEESFVRMSSDTDGLVLHTFSDGLVIVTAYLDQTGSLFDCHVTDRNSTASRQFFKEAVLSERSSSAMFSMREIDVRKLGRKCKKFLRDTIRKPLHLLSEKERRSRDRIELDQPQKGTHFCQRAPRPNRSGKLGDKEELDACCKEFHRCPSAVPGFSFEQGYFNPLPWAVPSCSCSKAFIECLRKLGEEEDARLVGRRFFDRLRLPCLEREERKECSHFDEWHSTCLTTSHVQVAVPKIGPKFDD